MKSVRCGDRAIRAGLCSSALWLLLASSSGAAQERLRTAGPGSPEHCQVAAVVDAVFGNRTGPIAFSAISGVAVDRQGRLFIADAIAGAVTLLDGDGNFIRRIGAPGRGHGQFREPYRLALAGSELFVLDRALGRIVVFDTSGRPRREGLVPVETTAQPFLTALPGGGVLYAGIDSAGRVIHELDAQFRQVRAYGQAVAGQDSSTTQVLGTGALGLAGNGAVWFAPVSSSEIRRYSREGRLQVVLSRSDALPYDPRPLVSRVPEGQGHRLTFDHARARSVNLIVDKKGWLWHFIRDQPGGRMLIEVIDQAGAYQREYTLPLANAPGRLGLDGRLYGITLQRGFPQLARYRLVPLDRKVSPQCAVP